MSARKRLLCIDDHEDTCDLVSSILKEYDVIAEHSKTGGLRQAATEQFDVILVDYHLPDGNGLELCVLIRAFDPDTPILLVTATHSLTHDQIIAVGGQGIIRKDRLSQLLPVAVARTLEVKLLQDVGV